MREISCDSISVFLQVKWHPSKEGLLAFGADDGQVGVYNIISKKCVSMLIGHSVCVFLSLAGLFMHTQLIYLHLNQANSELEILFSLQKGIP